MRHAGEAIIQSGLEFISPIQEMAELFTDNFGRMMVPDTEVERDVFPGRLVGPATR